MRNSGLLELFFQKLVDRMKPQEMNDIIKIIAILTEPRKWQRWMGKLSREEEVWGCGVHLASLVQVRSIDRIEEAATGWLVRREKREGEND